MELQNTPNSPSKRKQKDEAQHPISKHAMSDSNQPNKALALTRTQNTETEQADKKQHMYLEQTDF